MPWSQMINMNIRPPRPSAPRKLANTPAVKARIRNSCNRNIGSLVRTSIQQNKARKATPRPSSMRTVGFVHPIGCCPYGSIP